MRKWTDLNGNTESGTPCNDVSSRVEAFTIFLSDNTVNCLLRSIVGKDSGSHIEKQLFSAKSYVHICSPLISPSYVKRLLVLLVDSGVRARIITSDDDAKDKYGDKTPKLLKNGVKSERKFLAKPREPSDKPPLEFKLIKRGHINACLYVVDGTYAVAGSSNLTEECMWNNLEYLLIAETSDEVSMLARDFETFWSEYSQGEIAKQHVVDGGLWNRIKDGIR